MNSILKILFLTLFAISSLKSQELPEFRWAADAEGNAPYIFQDPSILSKNIGFEVDIANAIAAQMGMKAVFIQNQWDGLIPGLQSGNYDAAMNGLEITGDREKVVSFSIPYYKTYEQIVVVRGTQGINSLDDLNGQTVGCLKNSLAERILLDEGDIDVLTYEGEVNAFTDMINGRINIALVDAPIALYYCSWNPEFELVGPPVGDVEYGIALRKEDTVLLNKVNKAIYELAASGQLREIYGKWNLWNYKMKLFFNDHDEVDISPTEFDRFVASQGNEVNFSVKLHQYIGFLPLIGEAALMTLGISIFAMILAILFGLFLALTRVYAPAPFSWLAVSYIEIIRGTPLLIQLIFIFYALPTIGIKLSPFMAAVIGLGLNYAAYEAENYRAGLNSVPRGQTEAAISLGMTKYQSLRHIILPQAVRLVIPPITNDFISLLKDSSLVSVITLVELTKLYSRLAATYYDYFGIGIMIAAVYLLIGLPFVRLSRITEKVFAIDKRKN